MATDLDRLTVVATDLTRVGPSCGAALVERIGFLVTDNLLAGSGRCPVCGDTIPGRW